MAQPLVTNMNVNGVTSSDTKENHNQNANNETVSQNQPTVRHIPIFVEGRDEPLLNKNIDQKITDGGNRPPPPINDMPKPGSIFNRAKDIPVRRNIPEFHSNVTRSASPARTIPINVLHTSASENNANETPIQQNQHQQNDQKQQQPPQSQKHPSAERQTTPKPTPPENPISKIQKIQHEILSLMDRVEKFNGGSRKDKEYMYLDEMLTQNLLKLDTIDTEGKDNIKAARKEAINCINKCISVLEAKADMNTQIDQNGENNATNDGKNNSTGDVTQSQLSP